MLPLSTKPAGKFSPRRHNPHRRIQNRHTANLLSTHRPTSQFRVRTHSARHACKFHQLKPSWLEPTLADWTSDNETPYIRQKWLNNCEKKEKTLLAWCDRFDGLAVGGRYRKRAGTSRYATLEVGRLAQDVEDDLVEIYVIRLKR